MSDPSPSIETTFDCVFRLWPANGSLAEALSSVGVVVSTAVEKQWRRRDSIPSRYFAAIAEVARAAGGHDVTIERLVRIDAAQADVLPLAPLTPDAARDSGGGPPRPATSAAGPHPIGAPPELPQLAGVGARESAAAPVIFPSPSEAAE